VTNAAGEEVKRMATREKAMEQSGKTKLTDVPARKVDKATAEQVKGGAKRPIQPCI